MIFKLDIQESFMESPVLNESLNGIREHIMYTFQGKGTENAKSVTGVASRNVGKPQGLKESRCEAGQKPGPCDCSSL